MNEELRKRLEEATENFRGCFLERMNKCRKLKGQEPYSADNVIMDICLDAAELGYKEGAELGYKEAIKVTKKLLEKKLSYVPIEGFLADFENDMNKLWEGEK